MFLEKNLAVLKKRFPEYVDLIRNAPISGRYTPMKANDGTINIMDNSTGLIFYNNISPASHATHDLRTREINLSSLAVFLGSGIFYQVSEYLKTYSESRVIVIECNAEILKLTFTHINLASILGYDKFYLCMNTPNMSINLYNILCDRDNKFFCKAFNVIDHPGSFSAYRDFYIGAINVLKQSVLTMLSRYGNDPDDGLLGIKNTFYNINTIIENPGIKDLKNAFKNKPGIVVSAGPSLNKNIHLLEGLADKAVIAGADTLLPVLQKRGFKPHFVTSLERISLVAKLYEGQTEESTKDIYLAACPVIPPEAYAAFPGEKVIAYRDFATFKWLDIEKGTMDIGPSAGNMAFNILEYMGCNPIILIGQDLAYQGDKVSHVEGTVLGEKQQSQHHMFEVEGSVEPKVKTMWAWQMFREFLEVSISETKSKVIDATEGGAKIHGTEIMPFSEAIEKYIKGPFTPLDTIKRKLKKPFAAAKVNETKKLIKKVKDAIAYADKLIITYTNLVEEYNTIFMKLESDLDMTEYTDEVKASIDTYYDSLRKAELTTASQDFYLIFMHYVQAYLISSVVEINEMRNRKKGSLRDDMAIFQRYTEMYLTLAKLIGVMKVELIRMQELLENNLKTV